jgi:hypothetical protein
VSEESASSLWAVRRPPPDHRRGDRRRNGGRRDDASLLEVLEQLRTELVDDGGDVVLESCSHRSELVELLDVSRDDGEEEWSQRSVEAMSEAYVRRGRETHL